jgi:hypothetical protein
MRLKVLTAREEALKGLLAESSVKLAAFASPSSPAYKALLEKLVAQGAAKLAGAGALKVRCRQVDLAAVQDAAAKAGKQVSVDTITVVEPFIHEHCELGHSAFLIPFDDCGNGAGKHMLVVLPCRGPNRHQLVLDVEAGPIADVDRDIFDPLIEADQSTWDDSGVNDLAVHVSSPGTTSLKTWAT